MLAVLPPGMGATQKTKWVSSSRRKEIKANNILLDSDSHHIMNPCDFDSPRLFAFLAYSSIWKWLICE